MMLFIRCLFWLENWRFSTDVRVYYILDEKYFFVQCLAGNYLTSYLSTLSLGHISTGLTCTFNLDHMSTGIGYNLYLLYRTVLFCKDIAMQKVVNVFVKFLGENINLEEVWNSRVTKSSYETELCKMKSHFELILKIFYCKTFFRVTNSTS